MTTKTFSGRADEKDLLFVDALTREQFGTSFGTYCATTLIQAIRQGCELPRPDRDVAAPGKEAAISRMKQLSELPHDPAIGRLSDQEVADLLASRYA